MKVLLTGMTSGHTSKKLHQSNLGFYGVLDQALTEIGYEVVWAKPDITWNAEYFEIYDAIFVGLVPPTSVSANQAYGALTTINELFNSSKLYLVVDNPKHWLIKPSLKSVLNDTKSLIKPFYQKRSQYALAKEPKHLDRMLNACERLLEEVWPATIYPGLPWKSDESVSDHLPSGAASSVLGLNFDALLLKSSNLEVRQTPTHWAASNHKSKWSENMSNHVSLPIKPLKASKKETDSDAQYALKTAIGLLAAPQDRIGGTWWSPSYAQAMSLTTPIATEWRESSSISASWSLLPSSIEDMTPEARFDLALRQKEAYLSSIPSQNEALETLKTLLEQSNRR